MNSILFFFTQILNQNCHLILFLTYTALVIVGIVTTNKVKSYKCKIFLIYCVQAINSNKQTMQESINYSQKDKKWMKQQISKQGLLYHNNQQSQFKQLSVSIHDQYYKNDFQNAESQISIDENILRQKRQTAQQYISLIQKIKSNWESQEQNKCFTFVNLIEMIKIIRKWPNEQITNKLIQIKQESKKQQHIQDSLKIISKFSQNYHYYGSINNQTLHGYGLIIYLNTRKQIQDQNATSFEQSIRFYEGQFQNNSKHGSGLQCLNSNIYIGKFTNNQPEGEYGLLLTYNFNFKNIIETYFGSFLTGQKHGQGKWKGQSGEYFGTWRHNQPEGQGQLLNGQSKYTGSIKGGYKHGRGKQLFSNGDRYQGQYLNGKPQGNGIYYWNNGAIYKGQFKNGFRYGCGQWKFGHQIYKGNYVNDKRWGQGKYYWNQSNFYQGQFYDDLRHGYGQMNWNQQTIYKGLWKQGYQCGKGQIWVQGKLSQVGIFQDGILIRQIAIPRQQDLNISKQQGKSKLDYISKLKENKNKHKVFQLKLKSNSFQSDHIKRENRSKPLKKIQEIIQIQDIKNKTQKDNKKSAYGSVYLPKSHRKANSVAKSQNINQVNQKFKSKDIKIPQLNKSYEKVDVQSKNFQKQKNDRLWNSKQKIYQIGKSQRKRIQQERIIVQKQQDKNKLYPIKWNNVNKFENKSYYGNSYGRYSSYDNQDV